jgi:hypothetical protein
VKLLLYDRSGFVMVLKRLEEDRFHWLRVSVSPGRGLQKVTDSDFGKFGTAVPESLGHSSGSF